MKQRFFALLCLLGLSLSALADAPHLPLQIGLFRIDAEVVADQPSRMQGLMYRQSMPQHQGMLFVFDRLDRHCMWMRNTLLPLAVAFIDESGKILNVEEMLPQTENNHCAAAPARFALEMNKGWFASKKIKPGTVIKGLDKAPPPR